MGKSKKTKKSSKNQPNQQQQQQQHGFIMVDPARIRFQHSRIRPYFSGCGRSVLSTLEQIRNGEMTVNDLPPIQVIIGNESNNNNNGDDGPWYYSLNNRRLWVLKRCREENLLSNDDNLVRVRVRMAKSESEMKRYCVENCALEATFVREKKKKDITTTEENEGMVEEGEVEGGEEKEVGG